MPFVRDAGKETRILRFVCKQCVSMNVYMSVCLLSLSICLSVSQSVCLSVYFLCLSVSQSVISQSVCLSVCLSTFSVYLFVSQSVRQSVCLYLPQISFVKDKRQTEFISKIIKFEENNIPRPIIYL